MRVIITEIRLTSRELSYVVQPLNFRLSKWVSLEKSNDTSSSKPIKLMAGK